MPNLALGANGATGDRLDYVVYNAIKNHWRGSAAPASIQPGMIRSDSDDEKLYHRGAAAEEEILQETRSADRSPIFSGISLHPLMIDDGDSPYLPLSADYAIYADATADPVIVELPAATGSGRILTIKKIDLSANAVTVACSSGDLIDDGSTFVLANEYESISVQDVAAGIWQIKTAYIPAYPTSGGGGSPGFPTFEDNFDDASIFENYVQYGTSGSVRTIVESSGVLAFAGSAGQDCSTHIPRVVLPVPYWPCEIETYLTAYNKGERTVAGLCIGPDGQGSAASGENRMIEQVYSSGDGLDRVRVEGNGVSLATAANSTIPKWFKIRCLGSHKYAKWLFYYSTDGTNWTLLYTYTVGSALGGLCAYLFIGNWYNQPAVSASFDYLKITSYLAEGPG